MEAPFDEPMKSRSTWNKLYIEERRNEPLHESHGACAPWYGYPDEPQDMDDSY
jgi:hypothetical protein